MEKVGLPPLTRKIAFFSKKNAKSATLTEMIKIKLGNHLSHCVAKKNVVFYAI